MGGWREIIRAALEEGGWSLKEFCREQGFSESERVEIQFYLTGKRNLRSDKLERVCESLGLELLSMELEVES